jgi:hypothetical protein
VPVSELFDLIEECLLTEQPIPDDAVTELLVRLPRSERERWLAILLRHAGAQ